MNNEEAIIQNLEDAGCDSEKIQDILCRLRQGRKDAGFRLLESHRRTLLDALHREQRQIDCLDYLLYQLRKE